MKRIIYLFVAWLLSVSHASADNIIIDDLEIPKGGSADLVVKFNVSDRRVGFKFSLGIPSGLSLAVDEFGDVLYTASAAISKLNVSVVEGNGFAGMPQTENASISGTEGVLLSLVLNDDGSHEVGNTYEVIVSDCYFEERTETGVRDIKVDDFSFTVTVIEPEDGRIKFNENSDRLPDYNAGEKGDVRMKRTVKTGVWNTIVLPFTLTKKKAEAIFGTDVELATFDGYDTEHTDENDATPDAIVINFSDYKMNAMNGMKGGNLYLIRIHQDKDIESFEADDVKLTRTVTATTGSGTVILSDGTEISDLEITGKFTGSLVKTVVPADGLFISNDEFWYSTGKTNIKAFRGWFELDAVLGQETDFGTKVRISINGAPTYIEDIQAGQVVDGVYNMQGMFVGNNVDLNRLPKGIYIVNGKKVMVK